MRGPSRPRPDSSTSARAALEVTMARTSRKLLPNNNQRGAEEGRVHSEGTKWVPQRRGAGPARRHPFAGRLGKVFGAGGAPANRLADRKTVAGLDPNQTNPLVLSTTPRAEGGGLNPGFR